MVYLLCGSGSGALPGINPTKFDTFLIFENVWAAAPITKIINPYFFGGLIIMCAPALPGYISHGAVPGVVESPVDSGVAYGT